MRSTETTVTTQDNLTDKSRRKAMTIHSGAIGKLMSMFSNQYSNAALAVVREYYCNGDDSRIAAGSTRPTDVWLPTDLQPVLQVRDYGVGLDADGMEGIFATYGLSSKEDNDDETGGFGIGSKAAFTLGQQFTVTGFKDGVKTVTLFSLDDHGVGQSDIRFEGPTEEPNGVLIEVGVPNVLNMQRAAHEFFLTVNPDHVLVNGKRPESLFDTVEHVRFNDESVLVHDGKGQVRLQMGPVVYPVRKEILQTVAQRLGDLPSAAVALAMANWDSTDTLLLEVPMGKVTVAPSREDLRDTETTINRVSAIVQGIFDHIYNDIQARIDAAPSQYQAARVLREALADLKGFKVSKSAFTYNGVEKSFKTEVKVALPTLFMSTSYSSRSSRQVVARNDDHTVDFARMDRTLVVTGVPHDEVSKVSRYAKRLLEAREDIGWIVVSEEATGQFEWFEYGTPTGAMTWTVAEYRAELKALRNSDPRRVTEPSYTIGWTGQANRDLDDRDLLTDIVAEGKPLVIFEDGHAHGPSDSALQAILNAHYTPVILLPQQSINALRKRVDADGTVEIFEGDWKQVLVDSIVAEVPAPTDDERVALGAYNWLRQHRSDRTNNWAMRLVKEAPEGTPEIVHPVIQEVQDTFDLADLIAADLTPERRDALNRLAQWVGVKFEAVEFEAGRVTEMSETFPLFENGVDWWDYRRNEAYRLAVIEYINSKA